MTDTKKLKFAVIGAGLMGRQIASAIASTGHTCLLYDVKKELSEKGIQLASTVPLMKGLKVFALSNPKNAKNIIPLASMDETGKAPNTEDLERLKDVDIIIEAAVEYLPIKKKIIQMIKPFMKKGAVITTNTSGLTLEKICENSPEDKELIIVWHFFNPVLFMKLVEVVIHKDTSNKRRKELTDLSVKVLDDILGKNIVFAKDTPNFIGNCLGVEQLCKTIQMTEEMNIPVSHVDKIAAIGKAMGAFKTCDFVGHQVVKHVIENFIENCPEDPHVKSGIIAVPKCIEFLCKGALEFTMEESLKLGLITEAESQNENIEVSPIKKGFYVKVEIKDKATGKKEKRFFELDIPTIKYIATQKDTLNSPDLKAAKKNFGTLAEQLRCMCKLSQINDKHKHSKFFWEIIASGFIYSGLKTPDIADDVYSTDNAMRWGYNWEAGPFKIWDMLGVKESVARMQDEGKRVPTWVLEMLSKGHKSFYMAQKGVRYFYDFKEKKYKEVPVRPKQINLQSAYKKGKCIKENWSSRILDIGDEVACLQLRSHLVPTMNPVDGHIIQMLFDAQEVVAGRFKGLVIATDIDNFCAGANLNMVLELSKAKQWDKITEISYMFQAVNMGLRFGPFPVVTTPHGITFGGGCEIAMSSDVIVIPDFTIIGQPEPGVGVIPAGGGCLLTLLHFYEDMEPGNPGPFPAVKATMLVLGSAEPVAFSSAQARQKGFLRKTDILVPTQVGLIDRAKQEVLKLAKNYTPPTPREDLLLPGAEGKAVILGMIDGMVKAGHISEHDAKIGGHLAHILTGGDKASYTKPVSEEYILELEREAFVSLCGEPKSQERMAYMLKKNKPLRN